MVSSALQFMRAGWLQGRRASRDANGLLIVEDGYISKVGSARALDLDDRIGRR
jgi:hypothetical protein